MIVSDPDDSAHHSLARPILKTGAKSRMASSYSLKSEEAVRASRHVKGTSPDPSPLFGRGVISCACASGCITRFGRVLGANVCHLERAESLFPVLKVLRQKIK